MNNLFIEIVRLLPRDGRWPKRDRDCWLRLCEAAIDCCIEVIPDTIIDLRPVLPSPQKQKGRPRALGALSRDDLADLYTGQGLTTYEIAKRYNVAPQTIGNRLVEYGIPRRKMGRG